MAYLHCHNPNCDFSQDDFWHDGWNPVYSLRHYKDEWKKEEFYEDARMDDNWKEEIG